MHPLDRPERWRFSPFACTHASSPIVAVYISRYLQQLQASNGHAVPRHQNHQADQNAAAPLAETDHRRRAQAHGQMKRRPKVAFVDLLDSDDEEEDDPSAKEELDLELKL